MWKKYFVPIYEWFKNFQVLLSEQIHGQLGHDIFSSTQFHSKHLHRQTVPYTLNPLEPEIYRKYLVSIETEAENYCSKCSLLQDEGPSWPWSYGSWIYNYLCNQCLSPLMLWVRISIWVRCTTLCDKVCQSDLWQVSGFLHK